MSASEKPRLVRFFVSAALSPRREHLFMWATMALLPEVRLCQPHSHESHEAVMISVTKGM
jgi:hypothetical protein